MSHFQFQLFREQTNERRGLEEGDISRWKHELNVTFKIALNARAFRLNWSLLKVFKINFWIMFLCCKLELEPELELEPLV